MNAATISGDNPFPGLKPYGRDQTLFGRDRDLMLFKDRLYSGRTTLLFAASGVGKSSFLQAKVVPALEREHLIVSHARWGARPPVEAVLDSWIQSLARRLAGSPDVRQRLLPDTASSDEAAVRETLENAWAGERRLAAFARHFAELDTVLLLDQFEEPLNSLVHDPSVDALVEALAELINDAQLPLRVVFSMRQEFLAELGLFENRVPDLFANYYNLRHPTPDQAATIISLTATLGGAKFERAGVDALVQDLLLVGGLQPPPGKSGETRPLRFVVPPVLQIVCSRMWNRDAARLKSGELAFATGYRGGNAREVVQAFVEELIAKLDGAQKLLVRKALDFLVSRQGGKVAYEVGVLADHLQCKPEELDAALSQLATEPDRVFRRTDRPDGMRSYELYHDVYAGALTTWKASFDAELERGAQERLRSASKRSRKQTALGCAATVLLIACIGTCSTAYDALDQRRGLRESGDDYTKARTAYDAIHGNWLKTLFGWYDADEELAKFWDRRTDGSKLTGSRENAVVYALEALATRDTPERRRRVNEIIGDDLSEIVATYHTSDPIVALSRDGERYATLGRGGVVVSSLEKAGGAVLSFPSVEFLEVLLSDDGNVVWALGKRTAESKSYEQKAPSSEPQFGLWTRRLDRPEDAPRSWAGNGEFGRTDPIAWSISANGRTALCAWSTGLDAQVRVFDESGAHDVGIASSVDLRRDGPRALRMQAWQLALRPDGSAMAFPETGEVIMEQRVDSEPSAAHVLAHVDSKLQQLCYSPDGRWLAIVTQTGGLQLARTDAATPTQVTLSPASEVVDLAFGADGQRLFVRTGWGLEAWNIGAGKQEGAIVGALASSQLTVSSAGDAVWSSSFGRTRSWLARMSGDLATLKWSRCQRTDADVQAMQIAPRAQGGEVAAVVGERTLLRLRMREQGAAPAWIGGMRATLSADGHRVLVNDPAHYALLDLGSGEPPIAPIALDEATQVDFDFDVSGRRAFGLIGEQISELPSGTKIPTGRVSSIARLFAVADGDSLVVEADEKLWLIPTNASAPPRSFAQAEPDGSYSNEVVDPTRRFLAAVSAARSGESFAQVFELAAGTRVGPQIALEDVALMALDAGGRRLAIVDAKPTKGADDYRSRVQVFEVATGRSVVTASIVVSDVPLTLAFTQDGRALVARTMGSFVRIPLDASNAKPQVRFLARTSVVQENVPNWFDADDPHGDRPRVLVLDAAGSLVLERVRFDLADVEPIQGKPDELRAEWQRRLDLRIDGDGRASLPSSSGGSRGSGY